MNNLGRLHQKLVLLRRWRGWRRAVCGLAPLASSGLCVLAAIFCLDFVFGMDSVQRTVAAVGGLMLYGWSVRQLAWPFLCERESELEVALQVERHHGIQDQLVPALQFEQPDRRRHASRQLESAVIEQCRMTTTDLDVFRGFQSRPLFRRAVFLLLVGSVWAGTVVSFPDHVRAFSKRLVWQAVRYPTATVVRAVVINNQRALVLERDATQPRPVACAEGEAVEFLVNASGPTTTVAALRLETWDGGSVRRIKLLPMPNSPTDGVPDRHYRARLRRLVKPLRYQVFLGDAWTDPAEIRMIQRPQVTLSARVTRPRYRLAGTGRETESFFDSGHQLDLPYGSRVEFHVASANEKPLSEVQLSITDHPDRPSYRFARTDETSLRWHLPARDTVFATLQRETQFEIQVVDRDGLRLEQPLRGVATVQRDRLPAVTIDTPHRVVLPQAEPSIDYEISDDFGVSTAVLHAQIKRAANAPENDSDVSQNEYRLKIPLQGAPVLSDRLPLMGSHTLALQTWSVQKGDQVTLMLEVVDDRGDLPGSSSFSDPLRLQLSDEHGVISAISGMDEQSEQQLSELIQRQLEVAQ